MYDSILFFLSVYIYREVIIMPPKNRQKEAAQAAAKVKRANREAEEKLALEQQAEAKKLLLEQQAKIEAEKLALEEQAKAEGEVRQGELVVKEETVEKAKGESEQENSFINVELNNMQEEYVTDFSATEISGGNGQQNIASIGEVPANTGGLLGWLWS